MILDADHYRINIPHIKELTKKLKDEERVKFAGVLAVATGVPIIICCAYLGEIYGFSEKLLAFMERLKIFYAVTEIKGIKSSEEIVR
jgi:hypothetical protein